MKILIAEDEFISRSILTEMLKEHGVCHHAINGIEALEAIIQSYDDQPFDLVFLDIMMPEMDGQQALAEIRKFEKNRQPIIENGIKVIMTSSLDDSANIMKAFTEGRCDAYLTKPINRKKLLFHLEELGLING